MKIGELVKIIGGGTPNRGIDSYWNGNIDWITVKDFTNSTISSSQESITEIGLANSSAKLIPKGNIIIPTRMALGKVAINTIDVAINQDLKALIIEDCSKIYNRYLFYFLKNKSYFFESQGKGATVKGITIDVIANLDIELPSLPMQKKIVECLDKAQMLIDKRKAQIEALDQLTQSLFLEMFGDPIINNKKWDLIPFEKVVLLQRGFDLPTTKRNLSGNINVYGSSGVLSSHDEPKVLGGGIITGRSGSIGNVYYTFEDFWPLNTTLFSKETYGNNLVYLKYLLKFFRLERYINGTGVPTLNRNIVHKQLIYSVPIELQNKFGEIVLTIEKQTRDLEANLEILENMYNSLMQRAFKGELFTQEKLPNA